MRGLKTPIGSAGARSIDLAGCVLYLPLWRPDMVARGGSIVSGTGTMAETPLGLAVGANTVTSLTAGTFIITVPQAGTCASVGGGATITGSPVTLNVGVATTVTTGVTTGAFTVTTSNIIRSKDSIGHLCTVYGALWTPQGRTFDGSDDKISCGNAASLGLTTDITIEMWIKQSVAASKPLVCKRISGANATGMSQLYLFDTQKLYFETQTAGTNTATQTTAKYGLGNWGHVGFVRTGSTLTFFNGGVLNSSHTIAAGAGNTANLQVGANYNTSPDVFWADAIGEVRIYNRALSAGEVMQNYLATKWRYQ